MTWVVEVNEVKVNLYGGSRRDLWHQFTQRPGMVRRVKVVVVSIAGNLVHIGPFDSRADAAEWRDFIVSTFVHAKTVKLRRHPEWIADGDFCACAGGDA